MTKAGVPASNQENVMKTIELKDLKVGDTIILGDEEIKVLEVTKSDNMIGDGTAANYSDVITNEFPFQWAGIRSAGTGYADTTIRIK